MKKEKAAAVPADSSRKIMTARKPADGVAAGDPFESGMAGCENFRIPALVTLTDGTIAAAADARWNHTGDACGLDTVVSRSADGGEHWHYTFANYLGDYGNRFAHYATAFIDPALATDGKTLYLLVDLLPGGYGLNTAPHRMKRGSCFTEEGYLKLKARGDERYEYYLKDGQIFDCAGEREQSYTVDPQFHLIDQTGEAVGNVFYNAVSEEECPPYQAYPSTYLYLTKSEDGGAHWSAPRLLNLKKESEYFYGVGPGRGLVTASGRIIFACYSHDEGVEYASVIYSDDEGESWTRSADMGEPCSEAVPVEVNGTIYLFTRQKKETPRGYYISKDDGTSWSERKEIRGITFDHTCQMSAIVYSRSIDGRRVILYAAPGEYRRQKGRIFAGLVQDDDSIEWNYTYHVNEAEYDYSCLTELADGSVALLYEHGDGVMQYRVYSIEELVAGAVIG